jgi:hypothetical protein
VPAYVIRNQSGEPVEIFARDTFQHGTAIASPRVPHTGFQGHRYGPGLSLRQKPGNLDANGLGVFGKAAAGML